MGAEETKEHELNFLNTRYLMVASAIYMGITGVLTSFLPEQILGYIGVRIELPVVMILKIAGAMYLGFALLNWTARGNLIGGIYSRPVALGNFFHFFLIAVMLLKQVVVNPPTTALIVAALIYGAFTLCFAYLVFYGGTACK